MDRHRGPFVPRSPHTGLSASATVLRQVSATVDQVEQTTLKSINARKTDQLRAPVGTELCAQRLFPVPNLEK